MIHPHTELRFISDKIGYGVVATKFIPKGTITWALDKLDRIFTPAQVRAMDPLYQQVLDTYTYRNPEGNHILCWDNARFVNHSSNSNCITTAYEFEIAIRDIYPGEQLTDDYGYLNLEEPFEVVPEEGTDRVIIYPDDLVRYYHVWDEKLLEAFARLQDVEQPLLHILDLNTVAKAKRVSAGEEQMDSILNCYCPQHGRINGEAQQIKVRSPKIAYPF
ncbi:SET domain-containing protein [Chryseolinea soli]|uniref:SET domain-containing protein-lysine N-methyltransferase n=1 Tax=Chryseolinea soli TaxID=2321403 RepID=A0A385SGA3_9BACT|nr:SET domain-containing protein [Chryseolinea soli]AYB29491.1 SET domain-containing protein-lysine N-methyltransferase [Chryseolinea soli]